MLSILLCASLSVSCQAACQAEIWSSQGICEHDLHLELAKTISSLWNLLTCIKKAGSGALTKLCCQKSRYLRAPENSFAVSVTADFKPYYYMCPPLFQWWMHLNKKTKTMWEKHLIIGLPVNEFSCLNYHICVIFLAFIVCRKTMCESAIVSPCKMIPISCPDETWENTPISATETQLR